MARSVLVSGSCAGVASVAALAIAARGEGRAAVQPVNATSHWLNGDGAGSFTGVDLRHTAVGWTTNHAACLFWAAFFAFWQARRPGATPLPVLRDAVVMSAVAAAVDYGATPKRFTPGWEFVLSRKGMAIGYAGMALGLGVGVLLARPARRIPKS